MRTTTKVPVIVIVAMSFIVASYAAQAGVLPSYVIRRTAGPIEIDGNLNEADWFAAESVGAFVFPWYEEGEKEGTVAKMLWDDEHLYVAFLCWDEHISAEYQNRDDPVSRDDCAEVFVSPNPGDVMTYFNIEINAIGTVLDRGPYDDKGEPIRSLVWTAEGLQNAGVIGGTLNDDSDEDRYWTMEIAIPFAVFEGAALHIPPADGDVWRLGLNRCGGKTNPQYSQWSGSETEKPAFHVPVDYGIVHFVDTD